MTCYKSCQKTSVKFDTPSLPPLDDKIPLSQKFPSWKGVCIFSWKYQLTSLVYGHQQQIQKVLHVTNATRHPRLKYLYIENAKSQYCMKQFN